MLKFVRGLMLGILFLSFSIIGVEAKEVSLYDRKFVFDLPDGFVLMSDEEVDMKYPFGNTPDNAYFDKKTTTSIVVTVSRKSQLAAEELPEFKDFMAGVLGAAIPQVEWLYNGYTEINGVKWIKFEMTSSAIDTDIHNNVLMTAFNGNPLLLNFNSTKEAYPSMKKVLEKSMSSIQLK